MQRPKLLFLCQTLPFPADSGVHLRSLNVLRLLSREFDVTAVCFYRRANRATREQVEASLAGLREHAEAEAFPIPQEQSRARLVLDHLRSVALRRVYTRYVHDSPAVEAHLAGLLRDRRFDLVHVDSMDLSGFLPMFRGIPVVCTHHNVESDLLRRRAAMETGLLRRWYVGLQARLALAEERAWCGRVALNVAASTVDRDLFAGLVPGARFIVVPNGVDTREFRPADGPQEGVVFVGGYDWLPNRDSMEYFAAAVLPRLGAVKVTWVGRAPEEVRRDFRERHGIELTGYVDDVRPYVQRAACYVVPLRVGGGTRLKILDAWAMGKAVVSTSVGCEGLDARDGENILVRDDPAEFAAAVRRVLEDEALRARLGAGARRTAEEVYDWDVIGRSMIAEYRALLPGPAARSVASGVA
ncbi:MAG TPA: glycosyltransferase family 4 protein [Longimicrobiaceae bacterium]|nr:glycosyltransferase family 4 protein [Longimicrobiaceae bacterium]